MKRPTRNTRVLVACAIVTSCLVSSSIHDAALAQTIRRQHVQFCGHETDYAEDYRIFGWEVGVVEDGRIENSSGGIFPSTTTLYCPVITDSNLTHTGADMLVLHGFDDSAKTEVEVWACLSSAWGVATDCGFPAFSSGAVGSGSSAPGYVGPFAVEVNTTGVFDGTEFHQTRGYPMIVVRLPTNEDTRVTGYSLCSNGSLPSACAETLLNM